ncbi:ubiE/COQ5 methyltransferase family-domain-containing protein [Lasiosphaeria miniovina]|uniref:2-methoxy-6-polyprenyl-1,4-benzoquinol methylase, mitochondrial n=1 Tax=Lasiosphaeria miniovina TaxID=1954250 RepID=A0AA40BFG7_9PEZI|nr:ubiE/COQ5 methyltransferase family-domain-containing protein [Lasiosphaeria miniovina]KAK0733254.1 ubiE/COQ5 methyltransferase family-domain-containing protein [Lasiosphaeria miniovina]
MATAAARPAVLLRRAAALKRGVAAACPEHVQLSRSFSAAHQAQSQSQRASATNPDYAIPNPSRPTHFGFETVTEAEKRERVAGVFTNVAESYDRMNDMMSFGWHRVWKDYFVSSLNPGFSPLTSGPDPRVPQHILDIAGGTGDIAFRMLHTAHAVNGNPDVRVTISDINPAMLSVGKQRSRTLPASQQAALSFVEANAEDLTKTKPLGMSLSPTTPTSPPVNNSTTATSSIPDNSIDLYTVAFGIRNFSNIPAALREAYRVLKPGGVFACLEFSKADKYPILNALYKEWSFRAIPLIGQLVAGDRDSYQYLVESIERFPSQEEFRDMIADAGFVVSGANGGYEDLTGGVAAIHKGMKPRDA